MKSISRSVSIPATLLFVLIYASSVSTAHGHPQVGPLELSGELHGAPYRIRVPANWNGSLLIFAHGYRDKLDHLGEFEDRSAPVAPTPALEAPLLAQGYALAGSAYKSNGWAVDEGLKDTKNLAVFFRSRVGQPKHTILWALSLGSIIAFKSMEEFGGIYDGALCMCTAGSGSTRLWDSGVAAYLAYDVVFGVPGPWGTVGEVRNDLDFEAEVAPKLFSEIINPANFPKFEFIRLVAGTPGRGLTPPPPPLFFPDWVFTDFFFLTEARAELQRRAGGAYVQNVNQSYSLTADERLYLSALGVPGMQIDTWLAQMNARTNIVPRQRARNYVENNTDFNGKIKHPVLTVHTVIDPLLVVANESAYAELIASEGREELLFQTYTSGVGHCAFTGPQFLTAVAAIDSWVQTGIRPSAATFPAALGFVPGFVPPPFPQP